MDGVDKNTVINYLRNNGELPYPYTQIVMPPSVYEVMNEIYDQNLSQIMEVNQSDVVSYLYANPQTLAIIPFDQITPGLKVLKIDQISPFDQNFSSKNYELSIHLGLSCESEPIEVLPAWTNRDPEKFTSVLLTGTTALTRAIASRMEIKGNQYPGEKIKDWFEEADISHISNEVSYYDGCPAADPNQSDLFFCGRPEYAELFSYLGVDVIELTGNHLTDKGVPPLIEMMSLFDTMGIPYYAAGLDAVSAAKPLYFENNGNRIAFLGCNAAGPTFVYASDYRAGVNPCDMDLLASQVAQVVEDGYLPIVTFQYWETYQFQPMPWQRDDSRKMIDNGAVIVSGSQAHLPMTMEIYQEGFIHYGLGNLFFDQMDIPVVGTRREFADRHIFYDGSYLGVELKTAMLEDYSQPRPMLEEERKSLLIDAFEDFIYQP
jgi:poly-gamma-glutamate synthesis protein (capsule biosynthesis protein)